MVTLPCARIALIHALSESVGPIQSAFAQHWPQAQLMNLLDDSLSADLAGSKAGLDARMQQRFVDLADYAVGTGAQAILFTCSAFGMCIDAVKARWPQLPVLKPNEAMITEVARSGLKSIALLASFAPTLASMPSEFPSDIDLRPVLCDGALAALKDGRLEMHDTLIVAHAKRARDEGAQGIAIAQFSMARSAQAVRDAIGLPVFTTPESAVRALAQHLSATESSRETPALGGNAGY